MFWKRKKEFSSLQKLMDTSKFKELVENSIKARMLKNANTLNGTDEKTRLKESAFTCLDKRDMLTLEALSAEFLLIDLSKSTLPARERAYIRAVIERAIVGTLEYYQG